MPFIPILTLGQILSLEPSLVSFSLFCAF